MSVAKGGHGKVQATAPQGFLRPWPDVPKVLAMMTQQ